MAVLGNLNAVRFCFASMCFSIRVRAETLNRERYRYFQSWDEAAEASQTSQSPMNGRRHAEDENKSILWEIRAPCSHLLSLFNIKAQTSGHFFLTHLQSPCYCLVNALGVRRVFKHLFLIYKLQILIWV